MLPRILPSRKWRSSSRALSSSASTLCGGAPLVSMVATNPAASKKIPSSRSRVRPPARTRPRQHGGKRGQFRKPQLPPLKGAVSVEGVLEQVHLRGKDVRLLLRPTQYFRGGRHVRENQIVRTWGRIAPPEREHAECMQENVVEGGCKSLIDVVSVRDLVGHEEGGHYPALEAPGVDPREGEHGATLHHPLDLPLHAPAGNAGLSRNQRKRLPGSPTERSQDPPIRVREADVGVRERDPAEANCLRSREPPDQIDLSQDGHFVNIPKDDCQEGPPKIGDDDRTVEEQDLLDQGI